MKSKQSWHELSGNDLDLAAINEFVKSPSCGAAVVFTGSTRESSNLKSEKQAVTYLDYEAYEEYVLRSFSEYDKFAREKWQGIDKIAIHHRTGIVPITNISVIVAVSSAHSNDAFEAAHYIIGELKATAPIWKKEYFE